MPYLRKSSGQGGLVLAILYLFTQASCWAQETNLWKSVDIGSAKVHGTDSVSGTGPDATYTICGQGYISATSDSGHFYYQSIGTNGTLVARLVTQSGGGVSSRMGVMIRTSLDGRDPNIYVGMMPYGAFCQVRTVQSDKTTSVTTTVNFPQWVKVVRQGDQVSGFISTDGQTWTQVGPTTTVSWPDDVLVGLAVGSNSDALATATFDNVTLSSGAPAAPASP